MIILTWNSKTIKPFCPYFSSSLSPTLFMHLQNSFCVCLWIFLSVPICGDICWLILRLGFSIFQRESPSNNFQPVQDDSLRTYWSRVDKSPGHHGRVLGRWSHTPCNGRCLLPHPGTADFSLLEVYSWYVSQCW